MIDGYFLSIVIAMKTTLSVSIAALFLGLLLGLVAAVGEELPGPIKTIFYLYNLFIRSLPELFVIFVIYYGATAFLTYIQGHYVNVDAFESGVIALGIIFAAYASQIFISAVHAIPIGEKKAGLACGLSSSQVFYHIILPQMWRHAWPGLLNLWLVLLKDSSIVSLIGLNDMMNVAHIAAAGSFKPFTYYLFTAALYLLLTSGSLAIAQLAEKYFSKGIQHVSFN